MLPDRNIDQGADNGDHNTNGDSDQRIAKIPPSTFAGVYSQAWRMISFDCSRHLVEILVTVHGYLLCSRGGG
jgi:hypothetical protein